MSTESHDQIQFLASLPTSAGAIKIADRKTYKREYNRRWRAANPEMARIQSRDAARRWRATHLEQARIKDRKIRQRRMKFKEQTITLAENPRKGLCTDCGATGVRTNIHHEKYDPANPLAHTIELCVSCHNKRHLGRSKDEH